MELDQHQIEALQAIQKFGKGIIHLPTGSGKTLIEACTVSNNIENQQSVFVILGPRIILCNQLYNVIKKILLSQNKDCHYLIVHSGRTEDKEDITLLRREHNIPFRQLKSTTSSSIICEEYYKATVENIPLIIFGTYDSAERIVKTKIPIFITICDEAQYLVSEEFSWICCNFKSARKYFFTASLKETYSDDGLGMNNSNLFGDIIYVKTPLEMINAGKILPPRIHLVNIRSEETTHELENDVNAIIDSFNEHRYFCNIGAKLLVIAKGSEQLNEIVNHPKIQNLLETRQNLKIFDISSRFNPRINGKEVKREEFLKECQKLSDADEAIIFHIDILSEGIDLPGITAIMPMGMLSLCKFLQNLGRATRLHIKDREKLKTGLLTPIQRDRFIKQYAYIIIPMYGIIGEDLKKFLTNTIYALRESGFKASESVVIKEKNGKVEPVPIGGINELDTRAKKLYNELINIEHNIEAKEIADNLEIEEFHLNEKIKNKTDNELINFFSII